METVEVYRKDKPNMVICVGPINQVIAFLNETTAMRMTGSVQSDGWMDIVIEDGKFVHKWHEYYPYGNKEIIKAAKEKEEKEKRDHRVGIVRW